MFLLKLLFLINDHYHLPELDFFLYSLSSIVVLLFYSSTYFSRFDQSTKEKILAFILGSALKLSDYGKVCSLSVILYFMFVTFMHEELL
jgi:hypothetical protein